MLMVEQFDLIAEAAYHALFHIFGSMAGSGRRKATLCILRLEPKASIVLGLEWPIN